MKIFTLLISMSYTPSNKLALYNLNLYDYDRQRLYSWMKYDHRKREETMILYILAQFDANGYMKIRTRAISVRP